MKLEKPFIKFYISGSSMIFEVYTRKEYENYASNEYFYPSMIFRRPDYIPVSTGDWDPVTTAIKKYLSFDSIYNGDDKECDIAKVIKKYKIESVHVVFLTKVNPILQRDLIDIFTYWRTESNLSKLFNTRHIDFTIHLYCGNLTADIKLKRFIISESDRENNFSINFNITGTNLFIKGSSERQPIIYSFFGYIGSAEDYSGNLILTEDQVINELNK